VAFVWGLSPSRWPIYGRDGTIDIGQNCPWIGNYWAHWLLWVGLQTTQRCMGFNVRYNGVLGGLELLQRWVAASTLEGVELEI
jgi:hypothetical protein